MLFFLVVSALCERHCLLAPASLPATLTLAPPHRPEDIAAYAACHSGRRFDLTLEGFALNARLSPHYRLGQLENIVKLATMLQVSGFPGAARLQGLRGTG